MATANRTGREVILDLERWTNKSGAFPADIVGRMAYSGRDKLGIVLRANGAELEVGWHWLDVQPTDENGKPKMPCTVCAASWVTWLSDGPVDAYAELARAE